MRKLFNIAILALTGATLASCEQEHIDVQYLPENVIAPVLGNVAGGELTDGGADVTIDYQATEYGFKTAVSYTLFIDLEGNDMAAKQKVAANIADGRITVTAKDMNTALINAGAEKEAEVAAEFMLVSYICSEKGAAKENTEAKSNVAKATFTTYNTEIRPVDKFGHVWIIGDYCGWNHDNSQFLYDYKSTNTSYSGVIDFGEKAANGFKLTGIGGWDDSCNWGTDGGAAAPEAEANEITLISSGGSGNIAAYSKRFYFFTFNKTSLKLSKAWSADQIGIIGLNGDWNTDIVMNYNATWTRFWADIEVPAATEMKFRADAGWDLNWGVDCAKGGGNIPVAAGNYRVYLDLGQETIEFVENMYGQEEPM